MEKINFIPGVSFERSGNENVPKTQRKCKTTY